MLKAKTLAHQRALRRQPVMQRGGFLQPPFWQRLVGKAHNEAAFVIFRGFNGTPFRRSKFAKTGDIHRSDFDQGFTINHPLSHRQADAATLAEAGHHANGNPVIV